MEPQLIEQRETGRDLLREVFSLSKKWDGEFASLKLPSGLTIDAVERAENLILDWAADGRDFRAAPLALVLFTVLCGRH